MPPKARFNFKALNITAVADGLTSAVISAGLFEELGPPKNVFQVPDLAVVDFGKYSLLVQADQRRVVVTDSTGELSVAGPAASIMSRAFRATPGVKVSAIGFNYVYELLVQGNGLDLVADYIKTDRFISLGQLESGGFKVICRRGDRVLQFNVDPVWQQPSVLGVVINHHFEGAEDWQAVLDRY